MTDIALRIRLEANAEPSVVPANVNAEVSYQRIARGLGKDEASIQVRDVVRTVLDDKLEASLTLPDAAEQSAVSVALLSVDGTPILLKNLTLPARGDATLTLTRQDVDAYVGKGQKLPAKLPPALVRRRVRFVPASLVLPNYAGAQVRHAVVDDADWARLGLASLFHASKPQSTALEWLGSGWNEIGSIPWQSSHLSIDGRFDAFVPPSSDFVLLWWLQGDRAAVGAIASDVLKTTKNDAELPAILPAFGTTPPSDQKKVAKTGSCGADVPRTVSEAELVDNPNIYSEDAGSFCRPFSNPERVLSERSFYSIVRAEQPEISARPSATTKGFNLLDFNGLIHVDRLTGQPRAALPALAAVLGDKYQAKALAHPAGRTALDARHPVQWEDDIARYQASSVARGHVLEHRVRWRSNGYSLGTVAKTLTLAPRQVKRIQKVEFERHESARRAETTQQTDRVQDSLQRDRQIDDTVRASLHEWSFGTSAAAAAGAAGGIGFFAEAVLGGVGGAAGGAGSVAYTEAGRNTSASEEQRLRDSIRRYADDLRRLESMVVTEIGQQETVTGTSEVLRNFNYAHSLTVIYYQILRHLRVETAFAGVSECLFVPFAIKPFDLARTWRWRESIGRALRQARYRRGLERVRDVMTDFVHSDIPEGRRADQRIVDIRGSITLKLAIERPADGPDGAFKKEDWNKISPLLAEPAKAIHEVLEGVVDNQRDRFFQANHAAAIAANWCDGLRLSAADGTSVEADFTLASTYRFGQTVRVDFTLAMTGELGGITRAQLQALTLRAPTIDLPEGSVANVTRASFTYTTDNFEYTVQDRGGARDLLRTDGTVEPTGARITLPLTPWEKVDQRAEIRQAVDELVDHLNEHVEYYHKAIWWQMDRDRLYMLIDGFTVPGTNGTSIGSVEEREPLGIIGNSIVFRVSRGAFIGLGKIDTPEKLHDLYADNQPPRDPMHISLPTDGLYAQTLLDPCPALEEHFGNFDWALSQPDINPDSIAPELLASRRTDPAASLQPSPMPATLINLQNAPDAPAPAGLQGVLTAVTKGDSFRDLSGLSGNQANALAALQAASSLAQGFGNQAASLAATQLAAKTQATNTADQKVASIKRAQDKGLIDQAEASRQASEVLRDMHSPKTSIRPDQETPIVNAIQTAALRPGSIIEASSADGNVKVAMGSAGDAPGGGGEGSQVVGLVLDGAKKALEIGFDALGRWKSDPKDGLGRILQDALIEEAKKAALDQVKKIPCGAALIEGIKLSLAFANGVGAELEKTNARLRQDYERKERLILQSDEMTDESVEALRQLSAYQLNAVRELNGILRAGIDAAFSQAFDDAVDGMGKVFKENRDAFVKQIAKEDELLSVLNGGASEAFGGPNETRAKLLGFLIKGFVRQMPKSRLRDALKTATGAARGRQDMVSETFAGLCLAVLDAEQGALRQALGLDADSVKKLLLRELHAAMDAGGILPVRAGGSAVDLDANEIRVPATLKVELDTRGPLDGMTVEMRAAVDAYLTVHQALQHRLRHDTARRLKLVNLGRLTRRQAAGATTDDSAEALSRAARALRNLEKVVNDLAIAAGDTRLNNRATRLAFMRDTLGALFLFEGQKWDEFSDGSEPFASSFDLRNIDPDATIVEL
jgi:hypothetical protein